MALGPLLEVKICISSYEWDEDQLTSLILNVGQGLSVQCKAPIMPVYFTARHEDGW